ncbi:MAG: hypothetical protein ACE5FQ_07690 [Thiogranum sp.]
MKPAGPVVVCLAGLLLSCGQAQEPQAPAAQLVLSTPCDVQRGCRAVGASIAATVIFGSDVRGLQPFPVKVLLDTVDRVESVTVAFSMQGMDMGWNRYSLGGDSMSAWNAAVTLPICSTGRTDWVADFDVLAAAEHYRFQVPFVLGE